MPTLANFDPTRLPAYPSSPHKTGQARVFIDDRSQYLGRFGTNESHALYHLMCLRKLVDGKAPATRELRAELQGLVGEPPESRLSRLSARLLHAGLLIATALVSSSLVYFATRNTTTAAVAAHKPVLSDIPDSRGWLNASEEDSDKFRKLSETVAKLRAEHRDKRVSEIFDLARSKIREVEADIKESRQSDESEADVGSRFRP